MEKRRNLMDVARDPLAKEETPLRRQDGPQPSAGHGAFTVVAFIVVGFAAGFLMGRLLPIRFWR
jgi:hypothetical protein